jgi:hypothetical protein
MARPSPYLALQYKGISNLCHENLILCLFCGQLSDIIYDAGIAKANINSLAAVTFRVLHANINRCNPKKKKIPPRK